VATSVSADPECRVTVTGHSDRSALRYELRVQGILDERWSDWFGGLTIRTEGEDMTVIAGIVPDQAALHGLLTKINDLGLTLVSVRRKGEPR
jgi:hypothetical protein